MKKKAKVKEASRTTIVFRGRQVEKVSVTGSTTQVVIREGDKRTTTLSYCAGDHPLDIIAE